jgi:predicted permease
MRIADGLLQDLRYAARRLLKAPGFVAVAAFSLALGIGANATIFSFVSALFLRPLPVSEPERVVQVFTSDFSGPLYRGSSYPDYKDFREKTEVFAGLAAYTIAPMSLSEAAHTDRVFGELVTANYFEVAGIQSWRGRLLREAEDGRAAAPPVLVLGDGLWRRRFGADPALIGKPVTLNGQPFTVVGIAPPGFTGMTRGIAVDLWVPMTAAGAIPSSDRLESRGNRWLFVLGRLNPGIGADDAQARLAVLAAQLQKAYPDNWTDVRKNTRVISVVPESRARVLPAARGPVLGFFSLLLGVVGLVLLIACTNVASLLLARAAARRRETAVRLSLGASRGRLIRQLLTESVLLSVAAGGLGVLMAVWAIDVVMAFRPPVPFPFELNLRIDAGVLGFSFLLSILTGLAFGLAPALQASRPDLLPALKDDALAHRASGAWSPRRLLVVAQFAMSLVLLIGAGLFLQSLRNAQRIDLGFEPRNLLLLTTDLRLNGYAEPAGRDFYRRLLERSAALPGVASVSLASHVPLGLEGQRRGITIEGYEPQDGEDMELHTSSVGPGYFRTIGMTLLRGRDFDLADGPGAPRAVIVNETFARRYWPGQDPLQKRIWMGSRSGPQGAPFTVVGVARDGKYVTLGEEPTPFFYLSFFQSYGADAKLHVRTAGDPKQLVDAVRAEARAIDASLPVYDVKTMSDHLGLALLPARAAGSVLGLFGFVAVVLAAVGIYGVMAHSVSQRTRELGVRVALGARPGDLLSMVLSQGIRLAAVGVALGLAGALVVTRLVASLLYGVSATDLSTFVGIPLLLTGIALLASYVPARRAMKVDPIVALRCD